jgi:hypothetical protein
MSLKLPVRLLISSSVKIAAGYQDCRGQLHALMPKEFKLGGKDFSE